MKNQRKTTRLWVRNTSRYPMAEVWPLCKAALESIERSILPGEILPPIIVKLTNSRHAYRGRACWTEWHGKTMWKRILVRIGSPKRFETPIHVHYPRYKGDMPEFEVRTHREAIAMVTAHEIEHVLGAGGSKRGEFRCELSASDAIDYYRQHQQDIDGEIEKGLATIADRSAAKDQRAAEKNTPASKNAAKLKKDEAGLVKWQRKLTIAKNKVRKYDRAVKRYQRNIVIALAPAQSEELALAATKGSNEQA